MNNINIVLLELSYRLKYQPEVQFTVAEDCNHRGGIFRGIVSELDHDGYITVDYGDNYSCEYCFNPRIDVNFKLILRSLDDMTDEEYNELNELVNFYMNDSLSDDCESNNEWSLYHKTGIKNTLGGARFYWEDMIPIYDWFNSKGFDYRGLIKKGIVIKNN